MPHQGGATCRNIERGELKMAAVDYFLKIDGIEGEAQDKTHKNEIQLESFSWGETNVGSMGAGGGGGSGKVAMQDFHFVMKTRLGAEVLHGLRLAADHQPAAAGGVR